MARRFAAVTLLACGACESYSGQTVEASLDQLLIEPARYSGARVVVSGYASLVGGWLVLYSSEELARLDGAPKITVSATTDRMSLASCADMWVRVIGEFGRIPGLELMGVVESEVVTSYDLEGQDSTECWAAE